MNALSIEPSNTLRDYSLHKSLMLWVQRAKANPAWVAFGVTSLVLFSIVNMRRAVAFDSLAVQSTMSHVKCKELLENPAELSKLENLRKPENRCVGHESDAECQCTLPGVLHPIDHFGWERGRKKNTEALKPYIDDLARGLDLLLVGDSINEHWTGRDFGIRPHPNENGVTPWVDVKPLYKEYFQGNGIEGIKGVALGIAQSGYSQLQLRVRQGELGGDRILAPVVWISVGIVDLLEKACTAEAVAAGIVKVVKEVFQSRHQPTRVVLNSILPLSQKQNLIRQVNELLHCYCQATPHVEFFDATSLFISRDDDSKHNVSLFETSFEPNAEGYRIWGPRIVHRVEQIIREMSSDILEWKHANGFE